MTDEYFTCASCTMFSDCQAAYGSLDQVGIGCADWTPSARITSDKDRGSLVEGAHQLAATLKRILPSAAGLDDAPDSKIIAAYLSMGELRTIRTLIADIEGGG